MSRPDWLRPKRSNAEDSEMTTALRAAIEGEATPDQTAEIAELLPCGDIDRLEWRPRNQWDLSFEPDELAHLELSMWQAYYRNQPAKLFSLLVLTLNKQAHVSRPRATLAAMWLTKGAVRFARMRDNYERVLPDIIKAYRVLKPPAGMDLAAVAAAELRWWVVRRDLGLSSGEAAGEAIARLYSVIYGIPFERVAEAGRLRGLAAEVRDRGAEDDPDGPGGAGSAYWPRVAQLLRDSYRSLDEAVAK
jgi:hypothetical protein